MVKVKKKTKTAVVETPKKKKRVVEEEEETPVKKKKSSKALKNGKAKTKDVAKAKSEAKAAPTARHFVTRVLLKGAPRAEVKKRASKLAKEEGADVSFKTFDVSYFINYLVEKKGYKNVGDDERIKLVAPKS